MTITITIRPLYVGGEDFITFKTERINTNG